MRHKFLVLTVKKLLKSVYTYGSYRKIKTGLLLFWTTLYTCRLHHPNFVHAYGHYTLRRLDFEISFISARLTLRRFKVIQAHWFWCQSKARMRLPISPNSNLGPILHHFEDMTAFMCSWPHLYSTVILGCSRCTRPPMLGSASA